MDLSYFLKIGIKKGRAKNPPKNMRREDSSKVKKLRVPIFINIKELPQIAPRRKSVNHWIGLTLVFSTGLGDEDLLRNTLRYILFFESVDNQTMGVIKHRPIIWLRTIRPNDKLNRTGLNLLNMNLWLRIFEYEFMFF